MAYLNSDDLLLPGSICYAASYFRRHPEVGALYGHRILIDEDDREIGRWVVPAHDDNVLSWADYVPQETLFWRRRLWDRIGGRVDESFQFAIDWDLLLRMRDAGARIVRVPRFLGAFRVHARQKTTASIGEVGAREMGRLRRRVHGYEPDAAEIHAHVAPYLVRHLVCHALYRARLRRY
jgi:GT2 family glycosyltransferase